jgi:hypothetical protein
MPDPDGEDAEDFAKCGSVFKRPRDSSFWWRFSMED